ncbi:MAG: DUF3536 domain-containing protein [Elusimicrobia bacterium]|nr:DUF3536 domain-containing protein [Elusimicrobiota bacterium]
MTKSVCLHAAFLRSPRENPWTGGLDPEDSAYPYPDWTSRAHAESVGPFAFDPLLDAHGRVRRSANLLASLSFSFSPLWLAWLERCRPGTYARVLAADRDSLSRLGRGNALAQPYGDAPLTRLAPREQRTAVRWGRSDFRQRFGRAPEGLWLPGPEADEEVLEALVAEGFSFTVLPAARAGRVRAVGGAGADWREVRPETFNPTRPYRWLSRRTPGAELALFFPHELLGAALASGKALRDGEALRRSVQARFLPDESTQLVHAGNPGEIYGLDVKGAPAVLGAALRGLEAAGIPAVNYAAFLDRFPPPQEVELRAAAPDQEPAWLAALRPFAESLDAFFAERLAAWLKDPWQARDDYAELLADPSARQADGFLARRSLRHLKPAEARQALRLLELQRRRLLMLSDGDAPPVQALRQACRAAELCAALGGGAAPDLAGTGLDKVWAREIAPAAVDLRRAAAPLGLLEHLGVGGGPLPEPRSGERFSLKDCAARRQTAPLPGGRDASWSWLRLTVRDGESRERVRAAVCVHQLERLDLAAWVLPPQDEPAELAAAFAAGPAEQFRAELCRRFGNDFFTLDALAGGERLQVLRWLMPDPSGSQPRRKFLDEWAAAVGALRRRGEDGALLGLLARCRESGVPPDQLPWAALARDEAAAALDDFLDTGARPELDRVLAWLAAAERSGLHLDLFSLRSRLLVWLEDLAPCADAAQRDLVRSLAERLGLSPSLSSSPEACPQ